MTQTVVHQQIVTQPALQCAPAATQDIGGLPGQIVTLTTTIDGVAQTTQVVAPPAGTLDNAGSSSQLVTQTVDGVVQTTHIATPPRPGKQSPGQPAVKPPGKQTPGQPAVQPPQVVTIIHTLPAQPGNPAPVITVTDTVRPNPNLAPGQQHTVTVIHTIPASAGAAESVITLTETVTQPTTVIESAAATQHPGQIVTVISTIQGAAPGAPPRIITVTETVPVTFTQTIQPTEPGVPVQTVVLTQTGLPGQVLTLTHTIPCTRCQAGSPGQVVTLTKTVPAAPVTITAPAQSLPPAETITLTQTVIQGNNITVIQAPPVASTVTQTITQGAGPVQTLLPPTIIIVTATIINVNINPTPPPAQTIIVTQTCIQGPAVTSATLTTPSVVPPGVFPSNSALPSGATLLPSGAINSPSGVTVLPSGGATNIPSGVLPPLGAGQSGIFPSNGAFESGLAGSGTGVGNTASLTTSAASSTLIQQTASGVVPPNGTVPTGSVESLTSTSATATQSGIFPSNGQAGTATGAFPIFTGTPSVAIPGASG